MKFFKDADADLEVLRNSTLGMIGYGNQGRAQALNLRDSGLKVVVGVPPDASAHKAESDGFKVMSVTEAVDQSDVLSLLIPDEVQRQVYDQVIKQRLRTGQTLNFAHGYNIHYGLISVRQDVDVIMVAPRMIGAIVREAYERGAGVPAFVAVAQDASGVALQKALAFARGIGATRAGVLETTFAQETELDLFDEQGLWPLLVRTMLTAYDYLVANGFPPEMVALEIYGSEEASEVLREMAHVGFFKQMRFHSQTSQYGTLTRSQNVPFASDIRSFMEKSMRAIHDGSFAEEWRREEAAGYPLFSQLRAQAETHPLNAVEESMRELMKNRA